MTGSKKNKILILILVNLTLFTTLFIFLEVGTRLFYPELIPLVYQARVYWQYDSVLG